MKTNYWKNEDLLLEELKNKEIRAFLEFYKEYSEDLLIVAFTLLGDAPQSIQKVDELFTQLWKNNKFGTITPPIHRYLFNEITRACKLSLFSHN